MSVLESYPFGFADCEAYAAAFRRARSGVLHPATIKLPELPFFVNGFQKEDVAGRRNSQIEVNPRYVRQAEPLLRGLGCAAWPAGSIER
jgi:hypothetical protein